MAKAHAVPVKEGSKRYKLVLKGARFGLKHLGYNPRSTYPRDLAEHAADALNMVFKEAIYCTTFCNFGHYVYTGRPVDHECYTLPPKALMAEMNGDTEAALAEMNRDESWRRG